MTKYYYLYVHNLLAIRKIQKKMYDFHFGSEEKQFFFYKLIKFTSTHNTVMKQY